MSTWERRGIQLRTRLRLGYDLLEMNGLQSWTQLADLIQKQRPDLHRSVIDIAVRDWHEAMYDSWEGTAAQGRES